MAKEISNIDMFERENKVDSIQRFCSSIFDERYNFYLKDIGYTNYFTSHKKFTTYTKSELICISPRNEFIYDTFIIEHYDFIYMDTYYGKIKENMKNAKNIFDYISIYVDPVNANNLSKLRYNKKNPYYNRVFFKNDISEIELVYREYMKETFYSIKKNINFIKSC